MRYVLLIYTNEADRPAWGTPEGDAEPKPESTEGSANSLVSPQLSRPFEAGWRFT
jgi:hypothetical protein